MTVPRLRHDPQYPRISAIHIRKVRIWIFFDIQYPQPWGFGYGPHIHWISADIQWISNNTNMPRLVTSRGMHYYYTFLCIFRVILGTRGCWISPGKYNFWPRSEIMGGRSSTALLIVVYNWKFWPRSEIMGRRLSTALLIVVYNWNLWPRSQI